MPTDQKVTDQLASSSTAGSPSSKTILFAEKIKFLILLVILLLSHRGLARRF
jgi:hypothetical protein